MQWDIGSGASTKVGTFGFNPPSFFLGGLFGGGSKTTTTTLDPSTQRYVDRMRRSALGSADFIRNYGPTAQGVNAMGRQGMGVLGGLGSAWSSPAFQQYMQANQGLVGGLDFAQERFGEGALDAYMNPYQNQVIDAMNQQFDLSGKRAVQTAAQEATKAGAYGGSRSGLLQGAALGDVERQRNQAVSGALQQGYQNAYQQWMADRQMAAGLGQAGLGGLFAGQQYGNAWDMQRGQAQMQAGEYERALRERQLQEPLQRQLMAQQLINASVGPYGTTQKESGGGSFLGGLLGGAVSLFGGPLGGPIMGALGGLFGGGTPDVAGSITPNVQGTVNTGSQIPLRGGMLPSGYYNPYGG